MAGNPPGTYTITLVPPLQGIAPGIGRRGVGPLAGLPPATLRAALTTAQNALIACVSGSQPVMVQYAEGQGHRQVAYNRTNADELRRLIRDIEQALGHVRRGAVYPRFG